MGVEQIIVIISTMLSIIIFAVSSGWLISRIRKDKNAPEKCNKAGVSTFLLFSLFLIFSIWLLRFAVGYHSGVLLKPDSDTVTLEWWEEVINSLFGALRTFSMEEEYATYVDGIKSMVAAIIPCIKNGQVYVSVAQVVLVAYASVLNLIAPILGGAIILEILASVFPKIGLAWAYCFPSANKYFFSELSAASLALAKSIYFDNGGKKTVLIFTDTYVDNENEKDYELLLEAKHYGAICVRDDLAHVWKPKRGTRKYYLINENELVNLEMLMELTEEHNVNYLKNAQIYLFVQSDAYVQIEKQINKKFKSDKRDSQNKKSGTILSDSEKPTIVPIHSYRNVVHNLFVDLPLYEPLIHKKDKTKLNISILGNGIIGTEAFLGTYWFGQMLISGEKDGLKTVEECEVTVNVISKDEEDVFWAKIDYINPEIKRSIKSNKNGQICIDNKILAYDAAGQINHPYCTVRYINEDVKVGGFWTDNSDTTQRLLESDYIIVALGNDADNISISDKLRLMIGKKHLEESQDDAVGNVVIAYAVFNPELANTLNSQTHFQCRRKNKTDIVMYAFGSLEQVYSCDNIYMSKAKLLAEGVGEAYDKVQMHQKHIKDNRTRTNNENKNYNYWADLARAMHIKYKVFSLGLINRSVFDYSPNERELYNSYVEGQCNIYKQIALAETSDHLCGDACVVYADVQEKQQHIMAWLEHRRWNAFTRTMGYQHTSEFLKNFQLNGESSKNMELKLHPCLVEAKKPTLNGCNNYQNKSLSKLFEKLDIEFDSGDLNREKMISLLLMQKEHLVSRKKLFADVATDEFDLLDLLSYEWCKVATDASLKIIDDKLKVLQKDACALDYDEMKEEFLKGWRGVGCNDYKKYDYYTEDFNKE